MPPFTDPLLPAPTTGDNTGQYGGHDIRVKGDGRVQAVNADGRTAMFLNVVNAKQWIDAGGFPPEPEPAPEPEPGMEPTLASLTPDTAVLGDPDLTLHCIGTNFTATSVIRFADHDEPTTFVSDTEVTTGVKPSLGWGAVAVPVTVRQGSYETAPLDFTFTEPTP